LKIGGILRDPMLVSFDGDDDLKKNLRVTVSIDDRPPQVFRLSIGAGEISNQTLALK
jgi:hypothetical protein